MQTELQLKHRVTTHLRDLMKLDVSTLVEVSKWLEKNAQTKRDKANRRANKRLVARMIAARMALKACEGDIQATKELMDRTEGKVADRVEHLDVNRMVEQLEAARQRALNATLPLRIAEGAIEGQVLDSDSHLTHSESAGD